MWFVIWEPGGSRIEREWELRVHINQEHREEGLDVCLLVFWVAHNEQSTCTYTALYTRETTKQLNNLASMSSYYNNLQLSLADLAYYSSQL